MSKGNVKNIASDWLSQFGSVIALLILVLVITILNPNFISINNLLNLFRQVSINGLIAFGMTFVIMTGGIDLSVGSILALTSAFTASLLVQNTNELIAIFIGLIAGVFMGCINGLLVSKGKLAPFIATLATMTIFRGATLVFTGGNPITVPRSSVFSYLGRGYFLAVPFPVIVYFIFFVILYVVLHKTAFGRKTFSIGGNEKASLISGVNVEKLKIKIYAISGLMAAVAGIIQASRLSSAQPTAGESFEIDAIAAVVLGGTSMAGGRGGLFGTLIGALIIGTISNGLNILGVSSFYQDIAKGIVIVLAMLLDRKNAK
ncbi:ribose ABC transporter permease [Aerococcaceae bacterium zg-BR9]|uniref:ABC transporter permease subunit n=1 Tax=Aerococcaceae bacterium zg-1292 TaxID=2774330 RepID=UPI0040628112|nr:ribose ABC transporter permease [Aerococcaceae bacterium zg-BR9]